MKGTAAATAAFTIVPSYVLGQGAPSNKLNIAAVGVGGVVSIDVMLYRDGLLDRS